MKSGKHQNKNNNAVVDVFVLLFFFLDFPDGAQSFVCLVV